MGSQSRTLAVLSLSLVACSWGCESVSPVAVTDDGKSGDARANLRKPNIVMFLVDDLGWQDTSLALHSEATKFNLRYRTPNVERLAAEGVTFTNAYASAPVCTPTRTSLMTGQDPARTHITYWTLHKDRDTSKARDDLAAPAWEVNGLSNTQVFLPEFLNNTGYRTIHAGKAHFGAHETFAADPTDIGFEVNIAGHASGGPASYYSRHNFSVAGRQGRADGAATVWDIPGLKAHHGGDIYLTEALTKEVLPQMRKAHEEGRPFFLNFCPYAVHAPIMANERYSANYEGLDPREAAYATMIESVDAALGAILDELEALGIAQETLVIYSSDNGGLSAHARGGEPNTHNAPLRSGKGSAYEGGTRVPTVIRWPFAERSGMRDSTPIITQDFFPTILEASSLPQNTCGHGNLYETDGQNLLPVLEGKSTIPTRVLGWNQPHQWGAAGPGIEPFTSIRRGRHKLIYFHAGPRFELYDLEEDLAEERDMAQSHPGLVIELAGEMQAWIDDRGAQLSIRKPKGGLIPSPHGFATGLEH